jgi:radical SAM superfamily enzyme YgiQ (UPF0313 family)
VTTPGVSALECHLVDISCMPSVSVSLTLGYLQACAQADPRIPESVRFSMHCHYISSSPQEIFGSMREQFSGSSRHIAGFTIYFWNKEISLAIAREIKKHFPGTLVVFGGNEVTNHGAALLGPESPVDIVVNGEGERVFTNLLAAWCEGAADYSQVKGLTYMGPSGLVNTEPQPRIDKMDEVPSPFQTGILSPEKIASSKIVIYEMSRGCPFECAFCYWGGAVGQRTRRFSLERIRTDLEIIIANMNQGATLFLADANFGMVKDDVEAARIITDLIRQHDKSIYMFANWAKNTSRRVVEVARILFDSKVIASVTLSAQSLNPETLKVAHRSNIPFAYYQQLQTEFRQAGIPTYTELIFGMPEETYQSFRQGVESIVSVGGTPVIYPLLLLNNTEFSRSDVRELYSITTRSMPYQMFDPSMQVETVVGHAKLTYQEWLRGMTLALVVALFYCGLLKFILTRLNRVTGASYGGMLDALLDYGMGAKIQASPLFQKVFTNFVSSWDVPSSYDAGLIEQILGRDSIQDHVHYQALMKIAVYDSKVAKDLVEELANHLYETSGASEIVGRQEFSSWVQYQQVLIEALRAVATDSREVIAPALTSEQIAQYSEDDVAIRENDAIMLRVRPELWGSDFDTMVLGIYHGSVDTLRMFESAAREVSVA